MDKYGDALQRLDAAEKKPEAAHGFEGSCATCAKRPKCRKSPHLTAGCKNCRSNGGRFDTCSTLSTPDIRDTGCHSYRFDDRAATIIEDRYAYGLNPITTRTWDWEVK